VKKLIVTILALVYLTASNGATIYTHYCMGKIASWSFWPDKNGNCSKCGMEKSNEPDNGCCEDEHTIVKMDEDQKSPGTFNHLVHFSPSIAPIPDTELLPEDDPSITKRNPPSNAPPRSRDISLFLLNCVFRI